MLDNLYSEYEKLVNDVMKDHDRLLKEGLDLFAQTASDVQDVIKNTAEEHGYEITAEMEKIISSIEGMGSLDTYLGAGGIITQSLGDIVTEIHNAYTSLSSDFQKLGDAVQSIGFQGKYDTSNTDKEDSNTSGSSDSNVTNNTDVIINTGASDLISDNKGVTEANKVIGSSGTLSSETGDKINSALAGTVLGTGVKSALITNFLKNGSNPDYDPKKASSLNKYIYEKYGSALTVGEMSTLSKYLGLNYSASDLAAENTNHKKYKKQILDVLKLQGFSKGGIVQDLDNAVRKNNDSVIISANPGESVFNEKQTRMIQEYVNKGPDLESLRKLTPVLDKMAGTPDMQYVPRETSVKVEYDNVSINLPNVMNYEDFMIKAQRDRNFEKMIDCMVDSHMGMGNPMKKYTVPFRR